MDDALHTLLLGLAGHLPDRLLTDARTWLAAGRRLDVVRAVAFEALTQPVHVKPDEIALLRANLTPDGETTDGPAERGAADRDLAAALAEVCGERPPAPWVFVSALPRPGENPAAACRPVDLTAATDPTVATDGAATNLAVALDAVDRAVLTHVSAMPGAHAVWRSWRMPASSHAWQAPVRVVVVSVGAEVRRPAEAAATLRAVMAAAGDAGAQAEICRTGGETPYYQRLARACGVLLWAARPARPVVPAPVFDGTDPWFSPDRPRLADDAGRAALVAALRAAPVIGWVSAPAVDVVDPRLGAVVPQHLRSDGRWLWCEAVAYYLERHGLAPDPLLVEHLSRPHPEPIDEVAVHRAVTHLVDHGYHPVR